MPASAPCSCAAFLPTGRNEDVVPPTHGFRDARHPRWSASTLSESFAGTGMNSLAHIDLDMNANRHIRPSKRVRGRDYNHCCAYPSGYEQACSYSSRPSAPDSSGPRLVWPLACLAAASSPHSPRCRRLEMSRGCLPLSGGLPVTNMDGRGGRPRKHETAGEAHIEEPASRERRRHNERMVEEERAAALRPVSVEGTTPLRTDHGGGPGDSFPHGRRALLQPHCA